MADKTEVLFRSIRILTPDEADGIRSEEGMFVVVRDGTIRYVGTSEEQARKALRTDSYTVYEGKDRLLMPAFANTHAHTPMVLMRNAADDLNLHEWLFDVIFPMEERLRREDVFAGSMLGIAEMIRSGIGACADMYYHVDATLEAAVQSGIRMNLSCDPKKPDESGKTVIRSSVLHAFRQQCFLAGAGRIRPSLLVHSVYLYDEALYPALADLAGDADVMIQVHVSETRREVAECREKYGRSPVAQLDRFGIFRVPCIAAHAVHMEPGDLDLLAARPVAVAHNPSSNMKLGSGMADIPAMLRKKIPVSLGTDGAASNNALDMFREMLMASYVAKCRSLDASELPAETVLRMATINGMHALGFSDSGRIAEGQAADLQVLNLGNLTLCPLGKPAAAMVYSARAADVESLMVDGRFLMRNRELLTLDEERIRWDALEAARHITGTA